MRSAPLRRPRVHAARRPKIELQIRHDAAAGRFEAELPGGRAECVYQLQGQVMNIFHTEVPSAVEGRGVAAALVRAALDHARAAGWTVRASCGYVRAYMRRHPQTRDFLQA
jgi:predicted GNAT family acetyltransferase